MSGSLGFCCFSSVLFSICWKKWILGPLIVENTWACSGVSAPQLTMDSLYSTPISLQYVRRVASEEEQFESVSNFNFFLKKEWVYLGGNTSAPTRPSTKSGYILCLFKNNVTKLYPDTSEGRYPCRESWIYPCQKFYLDPSVDRPHPRWSVFVRIPLSQYRRSFVNIWQRIALSGDPQTGVLLTFDPFQHPLKEIILFLFVESIHFSGTLCLSVCFSLSLSFSLSLWLSFYTHLGYLLELSWMQQCKTSFFWWDAWSGRCEDNALVCTCGHWL